MGMSGYMVVTEDTMEDEHAMVGKDAVVDEEILAVVVEQPLTAESA